MPVPALVIRRMCRRALPGRLWGMNVAHQPPSIATTTAFKNWRDDVRGEKTIPRPKPKKSFLARILGR